LPESTLSLDIDPQLMECDDDGLPVSEVGEWALAKHERLRRYVTITSAVRKKWLKPMRTSGAPAGATYIELFCGPGRSRIRDTDRMIDGSPIVAASAAVQTGAPFSRILLADMEPSFVRAASTRLAARGIVAESFKGPATDTVGEIAKTLDPYGLHFAFIDPYNLNDLDFSVLKQLAALERMDMLIHVSVQDLQRNLRRNIERAGSALDRFAPGWREHVDISAPDNAVRAAIFSYWLGLIQALKMQPSHGVELVSGDRNQRLYWLVLVSRHPRAGELWDKIRNTSPQRRLL
jgi:three-Cys-motif partner protein